MNFYSNQYGFRQGHSTELAALAVVDKILIQMDKKQIPLNIFLELSMAFDCMDHKILLSKLKYYGFHGISLKLTYLENCKQQVILIETVSEFTCVTTGIPQGSILGPLLFLIFINDITNATTCFRPVIYADDTTLGACLGHFGSDNHSIAESLND